MLSNRYCALIDCVSESCTEYGAKFLISLFLSDWADWSNRTEHCEWGMPILHASTTSWWHATRDGQLKERGCVITRGPSVLDLKARPVVCSLRLQRKYHFKHFTAQGCHKNVRHSPVWQEFSVRIQTSTKVEVKSGMTIWAGHITRAGEWQMHANFWSDNVERETAHEMKHGWEDNIKTDFKRANIWSYDYGSRSERRTKLQYEDLQ